MNLMTTLYRWMQDSNGGDHGTLTLWPDTDYTMSLTVADFKTAYRLAETCRRVRYEAFEAGRRSMQAEVARIVP